ncbi:hypothetical protein FOPG_18657 [Fusarium oxysporum f. sp. conglutinans race 2 54008]|uniref:Mitochondrial division protein 1 n=2 Tax=Fusarium oxysporum f. sp. conglutinans TaxID=100902 RepID=X0GYX5_FUSOX|nr:hypothetical protein FOPG_18657 [Fusarium oxysporum f. sp. conglutinans race 2 54008]KAG6980139.1 Vegetative incompatibility protein HET-E-1 [Fusarium oxysporum f. sp. conglutinans]KAI8401775.1 hypothetical protein FOFC_18644 [Fusarium oxysporum]
MDQPDRQQLDIATNNEDNMGTMNSLGHATVGDNGRLQVGNNYTTNNYNYTEPSRNKCITDLRLTDPRHDKTRIEQTKGGLLKDSYRWILDHEDFRRWRDDDDSRLLWIKGDAGKGKTMLLCGIINELEKDTANLVCYFFCQGTDSRINNATAVLRGLIYLLIDQQPSLVPHVRKRYDQAGKGLFEDVNAWWALSDILTNILQDPNLTSTFLIIDALDECETGLPMLLDLIVQHSSSARVKWLVSSRNKSEIEQKFRVDTSRARLSLELKHNAVCVSQAVDTYIRHSVSQMPSIQDDQGLQDELCAVIQQKANQTFLWVSLVIKQLNEMESWEVLQTVDKIPSGLKEVYGRMARSIQQLKPGYLELCRPLLSTVCTAYRPLSLHELGILSGLPIEISRKPQSVRRIVTMCGSFLTMRDDSVYIVHQSAKDYLATEGSQAVFSAGDGKVHYSAFSRSLQIMSETLRRDMYDLRHPGTSIDNVSQPEPDPLASARYSCIYWVDHLSDAISHRTSMPINDLQDDGRVHQFLSKKFLYWLEALSLLGGITDGVVATTKLEALLKRLDGARLFDLVRDAWRFILSHGWAISKAPLQAYASALIFSPRRSITRLLFEMEEPTWIIAKPAIAEDWNACLSTLEGHSDSIWSVTFSTDGQRLASASADGTVKIWDATTGNCETTLEVHTDWLGSAAFLPDGQCLAWGSNDGIFKIWDVTTRRCEATLKCLGDRIRSVAFSPNCYLLASVSDDGTVKIWDVTTGDCETTLEGHSYFVNSLDFSPDGQRLAIATLVATVDMGDVTTVKIWDVTTGRCEVTLEDHGVLFDLGAFSPDGQRFALACSDGAVKIWDVTTGDCEVTLEDHGGLFDLVAFSPDGHLLASASYDGTVKIWDIATGRCEATLEGHDGKVYSVIFSPDGQRLASASEDETVKIWDVTTGPCQAKTSAALPASGSLHHPCQHQAYGISADRVWITYQGQNLLWLPSEYRPQRSTIAASSVALSCSLGQVLLFRFSETAAR